MRSHKSQICLTNIPSPFKMDRLAPTYSPMVKHESGLVHSIMSDEEVIEEVRRQFKDVDLSCPENIDLGYGEFFL